MAEKEVTLPSAWVSIVPLLVLISMVALTITLFGSDALDGGNQVSLFVAAGVCVCISMWMYKTPWKIFEDSITKTIGQASVSIVILTRTLSPMRVNKSMSLLTSGLRVWTSKKSGWKSTKVSSNERVTFSLYSTG